MQGRAYWTVSIQLVISHRIIRPKELFDLIDSSLIYFCQSRRKRGLSTWIDLYRLAVLDACVSSVCATRNTQKHPLI